ncbi:expressed unknown protein [Seminavis robusta]|uniref:Uncharacterized protein n=1 Tax=Seminavis robusta TaxID=568900 RepID=A0A9N8HRK8_9STRA|nr:expressed unknown protein [Seminavis robusta]|eukprot:Sro1283_g259130.1 n/a (334) ;mRNA; r:18684-19804
MQNQDQDQDSDARTTHDRRIIHHQGVTDEEAANSDSNRKMSHEEKLTGNTQLQELEAEDSTKPTTKDINSANTLPTSQTTWAGCRENSQSSGRVSFFPNDNNKSKMSKEGNKEAVNSGLQQMVEEKVLSTETAPATARQAHCATKTDSQEADDPKPATKESDSHQGQKDDKNKHDNSKSNDTINMDSASAALENLEARFNNPQQSGQLKFLPKEKQSHIKEDATVKIAADSNRSAMLGSKETSHDSSTFAALSSVEARLNNPGLSFLPSKSSGHHQSGIVPPTEHGQIHASISTIEANVGTTAGHPSLTQQHQQPPQPGAPGLYCDKPRLIVA